MFWLLKFILFVLIAMATGLAAVTVSVDGRTVAEHLQAWWDPDAAKSYVSERTGVGRAFAPERGKEAAGHEDEINDEDREALQKLLERAQ